MLMGDVKAPAAKVGRLKLLCGDCGHIVAAARYRVSGDRVQYELVPGVRKGVAWIGPMAAKPGTGTGVEGDIRTLDALGVSPDRRILAAVCRCGSIWLGEYSKVELGDLIGAAVNANRSAVPLTRSADPAATHCRADRCDELVMLLADRSRALMLDPRLSASKQQLRSDQIEAAFERFMMIGAQISELVDERLAQRAMADR